METEDQTDRMERLIANSLRGILNRIEELVSKRIQINEDYPPIIRNIPGMAKALDDITATAYRKALIQLAKVENKYIGAAKRVLGG